MSSNTQLAVNVAMKAGRFLLRNFSKHRELAKLRGHSKEIVTEYDKKSNLLIIKALTDFSEFNLLTEESGFIDKKSNLTWIVDSLDGSGNFALGNPFFSVSIALTKGKQVLLGVVYAPFLKELYVAEKGKGAKLNNMKIEVSKVKELSKSYLLYCEGGAKSNLRISRAVSSFLPIAKDMRKLGSAAIEAGYVASGRAEGFLTTEIYPWDIAAGALLVAEAGGEVSDFKGKPWLLEQSDMLLTNGSLHKKLLSYVEQNI